MIISHSRLWVHDKFDLPIFCNAYYEHGTCTVIMGKGLMMTFVLSILHFVYSFYGVTDYFDLSLIYCEICGIPRLSIHISTYRLQ